MASTTGHQENTLNTALFHKLLKEPESFDFFQAIRIITQHSFQLSELPQKSQLFKKILIEYKASPSLAFPISSISKIQKTEIKKEKRLLILTNFMGLIGQSGILPEHYIETILAQLEEKEDSLLDFIDLFHNQILQLFYHIWSKNRFISLPKPQLKESNLQMNLTALSGQFNTKSTDPSMLFYTGLLSNITRPAEGLKQMLSHYFHFPVHLNQYRGEWLALEKPDITQLSKNNHANCLGKKAILGKKIWHVQNSFEIIIGPIDYQAFIELLPNKKTQKQLRKMVRYYIGNEHIFSLQILIKTEAIPNCELKKKDSFQLGWNSWLGSKKCAQKTKEVSLSNHSSYFNLNAGEKSELN